MRWPQAQIVSIKANIPNALVGGPFGSDLTTRDYVSEGVPVIRGQNLSAGCVFTEDEFVFVSPEKAGLLRANTAGRGDLVFTQRGTLGQVGLIPATSRFERYVVSQSQMKLTVDPKKADARFVYHYFSLPVVVEEIKGRAITSGVPHINLGILKELEIPLPPIEVQSRIASVASAYDDLIENNQRRIKLMEETARRLYREWFVTLRFPGYERVKVVDGVPKGWERVTLADIAAVNESSISMRNPPDTLLYLDISSVGTGVIHETTEYAFLDAPGRARRRVRHGDTIWSCVRPNRRSFALIWEPTENLIASTGFAVLSPKAVPLTYLHLAATTDEFVGHLTTNATGAAYPAVTAKDFESAELLRPSAVVLHEFDQRMMPLIAQQEVLKRQCKSLQQARDALLPRLMSGALAV
jgi:type I restriction enzyme, S subunit